MSERERFRQIYNRREFLELAGGGIGGILAGAVLIKKLFQVPAASGEETETKRKFPLPATLSVQAENEPSLPTAIPTIIDKPKPLAPEKKITEAQQLLEKARQSEANPRALKAVEFAIAQLGDGYRLGAEGPNQWDCARLVYFAYRSAGVDFKGSIKGGKVVADQWRETQGRILAINEKKLPGDLIVFIHPNGTFAHVGMMIDEEYFLEASGKEGKVRVTSINPNDALYRKNLFDGTDCILKGYKRILEPKR